MKRHSVIRLFNTVLLDDYDIAIYTGSEMCKEAYAYDRPGNFYLKDNFGLAVSLAVGLAMSTTKKVFVFTGEGDFIRELASGIQAAASKCRNLNIIILNNKVYSAAGELPNLFKNMNSTRAMISSFGMFVHDYTDYFNDKTHKQLISFLDEFKGPLTIFIDVEVGLKRGLSDLDLNEDKLSTRLMYFIKMEEQVEMDVEEKNIPVLELNKQVEFGGNN